MTLDLELASQRVIWFKTPALHPAWTAGVQKRHNLPWCEPRSCLLRSKLQPNRPPAVKETPRSKSANHCPLVWSNVGHLLPSWTAISESFCASVHICALYPPRSMAGTTVPSSDATASNEPPREGRFVPPPSRTLQAGGTGGTCPIGRGRIITGKWQLSFCLTCFGRNSWGYYRN